MHLLRLTGSNSPMGECLVVLQLRQPRCCLSLAALEVLRHLELELMLHAEVLTPSGAFEYGLNALEVNFGLPLLVLSRKVVQVPVEVL